jgi:ABC-type sugar transport system substrate-binding protein
VASWPLAARAQEATIPVIGFLASPSADEWDPFVTAFQGGLKESGYIEGQNTAGRTASMTGCRHSPPIWFADKCP